jgi:hypothetical protein
LAQRKKQMDWSSLLRTPKHSVLGMQYSECRNMNGGGLWIDANYADILQSRRADARSSRAASSVLRDSLRYSF